MLSSKEPKFEVWLFLEISSQASRVSRELRVFSDLQLQCILLGGLKLIFFTLLCGNPEPAPPDPLIA